LGSETTYHLIRVNSIENQPDNNISIGLQKTERTCLKIAGRQRLEPIYREKARKTSFTFQFSLLYNYHLFCRCCLEQRTCIGASEQVEEIQLFPIWKPAFLAHAPLESGEALRPTA
jgi:hypothetical protein